MSVIDEGIYDTKSYVKCGCCEYMIHLVDDWYDVANNGNNEPVYICECCVEDQQEKGLWHATV